MTFRLLLSACFLLVFAPHFSNAQTVEITVTNIRNTNGYMQLQFFKTSEAYEAEDEFLSKRYSKSAVVNGTLRVSVELPTGHYGIALLDDENSDAAMNYNFIGMPKEGFGFSDYYHTSWSRPVFEDFDFDLTNEGKSVVMKIRYI